MTVEPDMVPKPESMIVRRPWHDRRSFDHVVAGLVVVFLFAVLWFTR